MKRILTAGICMIFFSMEAFAQLNLPIPSPNAAVEQTIGITKVRIDYSSPGVKGRQIWGDLVPYGKIWRTGANHATVLDISTDAKIGGNEIKAGKYAIFMIPGKDEWTVIINSDWDQHGTDNYDESKNVANIKVKPEDIPQRERMTFIISNTTYNTARIDLEWEKLRISFNIEVNTDNFALSQINNTIDNIPGLYANAAQYTLRIKDHYDKGLAWINKALELKNHWYYHWIKAELLHETGENKEAYEHMKMAQELGNESKNFFYKDMVEKSLAEWPKQ